MSELKAFIGHSFTDDDEGVVSQFIDFFNHVKDMGIGFSWEHAEPAAPTILSEKVLKLMENKNLFIGICTVKEKVIAPDKLRQALLDKSTLKAKKNDFASKTSDWIIQEIGVAIGRGMNVIILLEDGLNKPGGLQGDLEYIEFSRSEPSKSFNKIIEMLTALSPKKSVGKTSPVEVAEKEDDKITQKKEDKLEPIIDWKKNDYEYALLRTIAKEDEKQEQKIIKSYSESEEGKQDTNKVAFEAIRFYFRQILGKGVYVEKLKSMSNDYPHNSEVAYYLGKAYEEYEDYSKATKQFEKSAEHARNSNEKLARLCDAAVARCKDGLKDAEDWLLNQIRNFFISVDNGEYSLLLTLQSIANIENNIDKYLAYTERILDIKPDDHSLRFSLAFKYSELKDDEFSLFHYLLIPYRDRGSTIWNNIGVANSRLGIDGIAVEAYRESEKMDGTLAMSNIAHKFIRAGFLREAEEICSRAVKIEDYDKQVGTAIASIKKTKEEEEQKQKKMIEDTKQRRKYYIDYGKACIQQRLENHKGIWKSPEYDLSVEIMGSKFIAEGSYEKEIQEPGLNLIPYAGTVSKKKTIIVRYEGEITGLGVKFKKSIEGEYHSILLSGINNKEGLMIISKDLKVIKVYEKGTKETEKFYELTQKE